MAGTKTYKIGNDVYDIPDNELDVFLDENPNALELESFVVGKDTFDIPLDDVEAFKADTPGAQPLKKKEDLPSDATDGFRKVASPEDYKNTVNAGVKKELILDEFDTGVRTKEQEFQELKKNRFQNWDITPEGRMDKLNRNLIPLKHKYDPQIQEAYRKGDGSDAEIKKAYDAEVGDIAKDFGFIMKDGKAVLKPEEQEYWDNQYTHLWRTVQKNREEEEKDPFIKDVYERLNTASGRDVLMLPYRGFKQMEKAGNFILSPLGVNDSHYWKDFVDINDKKFEEMREQSNRYNDDVVSLVKQGKTKEALGKGILDVSEAIPLLTTLYLGNAAGSSKAAPWLMGSTKGLQEYDRLDRDSDLPEWVKYGSALTKGLSEVVFESIGTNRIITGVRKQVANKGKEVVSKELMDVYKNQFQKSFMALGSMSENAILEGATEAATELADNMVDVSIGEKNVDQLFEGVPDAAFAGILMGGGMSVPAHIPDMQRSKYIKEVAESIPTEYPTETKLEIINETVKRDNLQHKKDKATNEGLKKAYDDQIKAVDKNVSDMFLKEEGLLEEEKPEPPIKTPKPNETATKPEKSTKVPEKKDKAVETPKTDKLTEFANKKVLRVGEVGKTAHFATDKKNAIIESSNPADIKEYTLTKDIKIADVSNPDILSSIKEKAKNLYPESVNKVDKWSPEGENRINIPKEIESAAKNMGYDGITEFDITDSGKPSSINVWNTKKVVETKPNIIKSENPQELYEAYKRESDIETEVAKLTAIENEVIGNSISRNSFIENADKNNITQTIAKGWFKKEGQPIDLIAQQASESLGVDVSNQNVIDVIMKFPSGRARKTTDLQNEIRRRYKEVTGESILKHDKKLKSSLDEFKDWADRQPDWFTPEDLEILLEKNKNNLGDKYESFKKAYDEYTEESKSYKGAEEAIFGEMEKTQPTDIPKVESKLREDAGEIKETAKETSTKEVRIDDKGGGEEVPILDTEQTQGTGKSVEELNELISTGEAKITDKNWQEMMESARKNGWYEADDVPLSERDKLTPSQKIIEEATKEKETTSREEKIKNRLAGRLERLSGASFAIGEKNTDITKEIVGVVSDLAELGLIQVEKGIDHVVEQVKKYLPNIKPENIDAYRDDIVYAYDIKEPTEPPPTKKVKEVSEDGPTDTVSMPPERWYDKAITKIQNRYRRINQLTKAAKKSGYSIDDQINPAIQTELMSGKAIKKVHDKETQVIKSKKKGDPSFIEKAKKDNIDVDELGRYATAKHAHERNLFKMKERNDMIDGKIEQINKKIDNTDNEGVKTRYRKRIEELESNKIKPEEIKILKVKADAFIKKIDDAGLKDLYDKYVDEYRNILVKDNQRAMIDYGLETQETIDKLNEIYPNYVPYKVLSKQLEAAPQTLKGLNVKGRDLYRAKQLVDIEDVDRVNPIIQSLQDYNKTVIRGEKNMVDKSFVDFANEVPNDIMEVVEPKYNVEYDSDGQIKRTYQTVDKDLMDSSIELRIDGRPVFLRINDPALLRAMNGAGVGRSIQALQKVNNYLRFVNTLYNPEFVLTNLTRDLQTAGININAETKKGITRKFAKNILPSMRGIWQNEMGNLDSSWSKTVEELKDLGGEVGWLNTGNIEEELNRVMKRFKEYNSNKTPDKLKSGLRATTDLIESVNRVVEMASRVSAYKAAIDSGVSKDQAAVLAKNLTVNFNKKGELGGLIDSFYLFANAGIQGSAVLMKNVAKSPKVRVMAASITVGTFLMNILNSSINDDEYEKIPDGIKERNLIIMTQNGNYIKIPLPWGYNVFKRVGDLAYEVTMKGRSPGDASVELFKNMMSAFNPLFSSTLSQTMSPTVTDPLVQISENKNWFGGPIKPEQPPYAPTMPESQMYFSSVRNTSKNTAKWVNQLTGGTESVSGKADISPEHIDHMVDFLSGGLGRFIVNTIETGGDIISEEGLTEPNRIPFVRNYAGVPSKKMDVGVIYTMKKDAWRKKFNKQEEKKFVSALNGALKNEFIDMDDYDNYLEDFQNGQLSIEISRKNPDLSRKEIKDLID